MDLNRKIDRKLYTIYWIPTGDAVAMTTELMQPEGVQLCGVWMALGMNSRYVC